MIDLRAEFDKLVSEYGHDIIYIRRITGLHCRCWNEKEHSGNPHCTSCFGTGYVVKIETHKTRSKSTVAPVALPMMLSYEETGNAVLPAYFFYMRYDSQPTIGDLVLDVEWNGDVPNQIIMPYEVSFPEPERGLEGRIEYWRVACKALYSNLSTYYEGMVRRNIRRA
jgi:hypothetical protein